MKQKDEAKIDAIKRRIKRVPDATRAPCGVDGKSVRSVPRRSASTAHP
ncbi:hypothetical protein JCM19237_4790 [Photobacterium aphoticum]|uniref:Uncharacterized protein n=1 Tax=Photobacterium aphoticum TaxID=754436 RepID=A0A090RDQ9_9GAMM|nr:hypothetical protein JCM19237_4790 [Photobacterium aphoticum]